MITFRNTLSPVISVSTYTTINYNILNSFLYVLYRDLITRNYYSQCSNSVIVVVINNLTLIDTYNNGTKLFCFPHSRSQIDIF